MARIIYTPSANRDFAEVSNYIAYDNPDAALQWLDKMRAVCELLASHPDLGQKVQTKRLRNARRHVVGAYLIYYRPVSDGVAIINVIHGARDQDRLV